MTQPSPFYEILLRSKGLEVSFDTTDPAFAAAQLKEWTAHLFGLSLTFPVPTPRVQGVETEASANGEMAAATVLGHSREDEEALHPCLPEEFAHLVQNSSPPVQNLVEAPVQSLAKLSANEDIAPDVLLVTSPVENVISDSIAVDVPVNEGHSPSPEGVEAEFEDFMAALISDVPEDDKTEESVEGVVPTPDVLEALPESLTVSVEDMALDLPVDSPESILSEVDTQPEQAVLALALDSTTVADEAASPSLDTESLDNSAHEAEPDVAPEILAQREPEAERSEIVESEPHVVSAATALLEPETPLAEATPGHLHLEVDSLRALFGYAPRAAMGEDYLLLSAYFLDHYRSQPAASMRDINAELVRSGLTPINHALIEGAVSKGLMELLPDTTGNAFATEYRLTADGLGALEALLN